jgi:hypothetical protein
VESEAFAATLAAGFKVPKDIADLLALPAVLDAPASPRSCSTCTAKPPRPDST